MNKIVSKKYIVFINFKLYFSLFSRKERKMLIEYWVEKNHTQFTYYIVNKSLYDVKSNNQVSLFDNHQIFYKIIDEISNIYSERYKNIKLHNKYGIIEMAETLYLFSVSFVEKVSFISLNTNDSISCK